jgi:hypothetical protein
VLCLKVMEIHYSHMQFSDTEFGLPSSKQGREAWGVVWQYFYRPPSAVRSLRSKSTIRDLARSCSLLGIAIIIKVPENPLVLYRIFPHVEH